MLVLDSIFFLFLGTWTTLIKHQGGARRSFLQTVLGSLIVITTDTYATIKAGRISMSSIITLSGSSFMQTYSEISFLPAPILYIGHVQNEGRRAVISQCASLMSGGEKSFRMWGMPWQANDVGVHFNIKGTHVLETCRRCEGGDLGRGGGAAAAAAQSHQIFEGGMDIRSVDAVCENDVGEEHAGF